MVRDFDSRSGKLGLCRLSRAIDRACDDVVHGRIDHHTLSRAPYATVSDGDLQFQTPYDARHIIMIVAGVMGDDRILIGVYLVQPVVLSSKSGLLSRLSVACAVGERVTSAKNRQGLQKLQKRLERIVKPPCRPSETRK